MGRQSAQAATSRALAYVETAQPAITATERPWTAVTTHRTSPVAPACACGRIHATAEVRAINRFSGPNDIRYIAAGPGYRRIHHHRIDAQMDVCPHWKA